MSASESAPEPYTGLSSVMRLGKQVPLEQAAVYSKLLEKRLLFLFVKAGHKTQMEDRPNRKGYEWYPVGGQLRDSMSVSSNFPNDRVRLMVQATMHKDYVSDPAYRERFINRIKERAGGWFDGFQLDQMPIDTDLVLIDDLARLRDEDLIVILQCHRRLMEELGPKGVVEKLGAFARAGAMDYVLFDGSEGKGRMLDTEQMRPFLEEAYESADLARVGKAVAGGLDGPRVRALLPPLLALFPDLSWDAESRLHDEGPVGNWFLDLDKAEDYVLASAQILQ